MLMWVRDTSEGAMMITLYNALHTSGVTLTINDKGEGASPVEFTAHQSDDENTEYAPYEIVHLYPAQTEKDGGRSGCFGLYHSVN